MSESASGRERAPAPFGGFYRRKVVLVTGHTGFKGAWLTAWLTELGAQVVGYALDPPTPLNAFGACRLEPRITHVHGDVRDADHLAQTVQRYRPQLVFHLAAQSLVRRSFAVPRLTFEINLMGTVNVLEAVRSSDSVQAAVLITSDKCYHNVEREQGYRETDPLGGHDAYGASKACAELAIAAYQDPRFQQSVDPPFDVPIASTRAGNVIGGGDWAADRLVPDTIRAIVAQRDLVIHHPQARRPWQHVLEPLSGYLWLATLLTTDRRRYSSPWNFGPTQERTMTVEDLVRRILDGWPAPATRLVIERDPSAAESQLLRLDCSKTTRHLRWRSTWDMDQTLEATVAWYKRFHEHEGTDLYPATVEQIEAFVQAARQHGIPWAQAAAVAESVAT